MTRRVMVENLQEVRVYTCYQMQSGVIAIPSYYDPEVFVAPGGLSISKTACVAQAIRTKEMLLWPRNWT